MNIVTYASVVSMQPKQFVIAVYNGTKTLGHVQQDPHFVLQLLADDQYNLVTLLGRHSGHSINKIERLKKRELISYWNGFPVLKDALAWMELKGVHLNTNAFLSKSDHQLFLCDVIAYKNVKQGHALTVDTLRQKKIVRM